MKNYPMGVQTIPVACLDLTNQNGQVLVIGTRNMFS